MKARLKEILKVAIVTVVAIGGFSAALLWANHHALQAYAAHTEVLEIDIPVMTEMTWVTPDEELDEGEVYASFTLTNVTVRTHPEIPSISLPDNVLSVDEAAKIGALYIWEVFQRDISDMYVFMFFSEWHNHSRYFWSAQVFHTTEIEMRTPTFSFSIDAETGEWIDISYFDAFPRDIRRPIDGENATIARRRMADLMNQSDDEIMAYFNFTQARLAHYTQRAMEYAQRHFNETEVVSVMLGQMTHDFTGTPMLFSGIHVGTQVDDAGNFTVEMNALAFTITDETGRAAYVVISLTDAEFQRVTITTSHNDILPIDVDREATITWGRG
ncbi:MAG: hypothetical protein FWC16_04695 [Defluviitaleaceae bacterium]|nr:hypothetical protein [Defluviitaleaceae bacterium]MCL2274205.1 hypothetical protein [Defluviitaleaceae bacterium]